MSGRGSDDSDLVRAFRASVNQNADQAGQKIVEKHLNVQPTIAIRPGWPVRVVVHKDLILKPYRDGA
jgi:type IV secretion system protein VirB10